MAPVPRVTVSPWFVPLAGTSVNVTVPVASDGVTVAVSVTCVPNVTDDSDDPNDTDAANLISVLPDLVSDLLLASTIRTSNE